ncbi:hypothetical protein G6L12_08520 [Agrobacterium rhizogenes]|nr:hypothetical protein [Rhizobium rhizogenes]NTF74516.1 hypothetical protein [Rhizobium rhizogenes]
MTSYRIENSTEVKARRKRESQKNRDKIAARGKAFRARNPGYRKEEFFEWYEANRTSQLIKMSEYQKANRPAARVRNSKWRKKNKPYIAAKAEERRAAKLMATPSWADLSEIKKIYEDCARITAETGIKHHVDHIVPLQSKWVCGLHVQSNLQILIGTDNTRKHNKFWPDMWDYSD